MFDRHYAVWPDLVPHFLQLPATSLYSNLSVSALRYPQHPAIIYYGTTLTYAELEQQAEALAGYLQRAGVKAGDRVYAILRATAVVGPVNPMNRKAELEYLIADTQARVALCGRELLDNISGLVSDDGLREVIVSAYGDYLRQPTDLALPEAVTLPGTLPDLPGLSH